MPELLAYTAVIVVISVLIEKAVALIFGGRRREK
jgi:hypothetical protein